MCLWMLSQENHEFEASRGSMVYYNLVWIVQQKDLVLEKKNKKELECDWMPPFRSYS